MLLNYLICITSKTEIKLAKLDIGNVMTLNRDCTAIPKINLKYLLFFFLFCLCDDEMMTLAEFYLHLRYGERYKKKAVSKHASCIKEATGRK